MSSPRSTVYTINVDSDSFGDSFGTFSFFLDSALTDTFVLALVAAMNTVPGGPPGWETTLTKTEATDYTADYTTNPPTFS